MHYSKTTNSFYDKDIHGDAMPDDAVEISKERHQELMAGQSEGKVIAADDRGQPQLVEPKQPTPEEAQKRKSAESRQYLKDTDWYVVRKVETGEEIPQEILDLRAQARLSVVE